MFEDMPTMGVEKKSIEKHCRRKEDRWCCAEVSFRSIGIGNRVSGLSFGICWYITGRCWVRVVTGYKEGVKRGCIAEAAVAARRGRRGSFIWSLRYEGTKNSDVTLSFFLSLSWHFPFLSALVLLHLRLHHPLLLLLFLLFYTSFIGTPGIIRSEFVFSRPCAVLSVGVSSIRPATDYWTKTRGWEWKWR